MTMLLKEPAELELDAGPIAVDTEFHAENRYHPRLHLIQVKSRSGRVHLIDPHDKALVEAVAPGLLSRPWLVHAGRHDLPLLASALGAVPDIVHDTQIAAGLVSTVYPAGLAKLLDQRLGVQLAKAETLSDWSRRPLSPAQITYAAADVLHLHDLWDSLMDDARRLEREHTIAKACTDARAEALAGPDIGTLWTTVPGSMHLDGVAASVLQELVVWRENLARTTDRPPFSVLGNRVLLELAKRQPLDARSLTSGRRAPKRTLQTHADDLLAAIQRARRRPDFAHLPPIRKGSLQAADLAWWNAFAQATALEQSWAADLVLPVETRRALARGAPVDLGWRAPLLARLDDAREGALRLARPSSTAPGT